MKTILITGGAGFIGSHVVREFVLNYPETKIINLDALTYAGNLENLKDIEMCLELLIKGGADNLPLKMKAHKLIGDYKDYWECHDTISQTV